MPLEMIRDDLLKLQVDAIVNPSNSSLFIGNPGSVSGQLYDAAGKDDLEKACSLLSPIPLGHAVMTPGYKLPAKHIIHVAGPRWKGGDHQEDEHLAACYRNALTLALDHHLTSIAFPLLSSGNYRYPKDRALHVALNEIHQFVIHHDLLVYLVVYDKTSYELSQKLSRSVKDYLSMYYREANSTLSLEAKLNTLDKGFSEQVFTYIDAKMLNEVDVYKQANLSKAVFSKIRSNTHYQPTKATALALCVGLKLNLVEATILLNKAGYSFTNSSKVDVIVQYYLDQGNYDITELNFVLYDQDLPLLGSSMS